MAHGVVTRKVSEELVRTYTRIYVAPSGGEFLDTITEDDEETRPAVNKLKSASPRNGMRLRASPVVNGGSPRAAGKEEFELMRTASNPLLSMVMKEDIDLRTASSPLPSFRDNASSKTEATTPNKHNYSSSFGMFPGGKTEVERGKHQHSSSFDGTFPGSSSPKSTSSPSSSPSHRANERKLQPHLPHMPPISHRTPVADLMPPVSTSFNSISGGSINSKANNTSSSAHLVEQPEEDDEEVAVHFTSRSLVPHLPMSPRKPAPNATSTDDRISSLSPKVQSFGKSIFDNSNSGVCRVQQLLVLDATGLAPDLFIV